MVRLGLAVMAASLRGNSYLYPKRKRGQRLFALARRIAYVLEVEVAGDMAL